MNRLSNKHNFILIINTVKNVINLLQKASLLQNLIYPDFYRFSNNYVNIENHLKVELNKMKSNFFKFFFLFSFFFG